MAHELSEDQEEILGDLSELSTEALALQEQFASHRERVRERALTAVTHYGLSVQRVAATVGIDRRTLTVWLQVHNAEQRARRSQ